MPSAIDGPIPAEIAFTGTWEIERGTSLETVHFALHYPPSASNCGGEIALAVLGLSDQDLGGVDHRVRFELVREAGTFACEGTVAPHRGSGAFRFRPDSAFADAIVQAGLSPLTLQQHVKAAMFDVSLSFVNAIVATRLRDITFAELLRLRIVRMKPDDVAAFHALFPNDGVDEIVSLGALRIAPDYVDALSRAEIGGLTAANVAALYACGVDRSFIEALGTNGRRGLTIDEVVQLHREI